MYINLNYKTARTRNTVSHCTFELIEIHADLCSDIKAAHSADVSSGDEVPEFREANDNQVHDEQEERAAKHHRGRLAGFAPVQHRVDPVFTVAKVKKEKKKKKVLGLLICHSVV